jgi:hypothetical protein
VRASSARSRQCLVSLMGTFAPVKDPAAAHGWCPLCPENRQIADCFGMSALCQSRLNALHKKTPLFDHLVGAGEHRRR